MSLRQDRVADQVRDTIGRCFQGGIISDPRLEGVTVTAAKVSPDLQVATIYFRLYSQTDRDEAMKGLKSASSFFRRKLAASLELRRVPQLRYFYDESVDKASRIDELLFQLRS